MMGKRSEKRGFANKILIGIKKLLLEKYAFSISVLFMLMFASAFAFASNGAYASPIKENVSIIWDTQVRQDTASINYGTTNSLDVKEHTATARRSYAQFDLLNYTNFTSISSAKACFYLSTDGTTSNITIYTVRIGGANLENTMTWNNQPCGTAFNNATACNLTAQSEITSTGVNSYKCFNVSFITQAVADKNLSNITFALKSPEISILAIDGFDSREIGTNTKPYMEITYCNPNWVAYNSSCGNNLNTSCGTFNNYTAYYVDANNCNSPRGLPENNGTCVSCSSLPIINFVSQSPNIITNTNLKGIHGLNITYSISNGGSGLNLSTIKLFFKANSTIWGEIVRFVNGTAINGFENQSYTSNASSNFLFKLDDEAVYPSSTNLPFDLFEETLHSKITLGNNTYLAVEILNMSLIANNLTTYGTFSIMLNRTNASVTSFVDVYYCNSSYNFASDVSNVSDLNCYKIGLIDGSENHSHSSYNFHYFTFFEVTKNTNQVGTTQITPKSFFIIKGDGWDVYYIQNVSRTGAIKLSVNAGLTWVNQNFTVDAHIHPFTNFDYLYYYACAKDNSGNEVCSSPIQYQIFIAQISPSIPSIIIPASNTYSGIMNITYFASTSPSGNQIMNYSIHLMNIDNTLNQTIILNNGVNTNYAWNTALIQDGDYKIKVTARDNISLFSYDISEIFRIQNCVPNWVENGICGVNTNASCLGYNNKTRVYIDTNNCSISTIPADNGTCGYCDYCIPSWYCGSLATCSNFWAFCNYINGENATNYGTCCAVTNLASDCNFTGDLGQFKKPCGEMTTTLIVNQDYPYIDCNTSATFGMIIRINNTKQNFEHLYFEFPTIPYRFNWTFNNATTQYDITLYFSQEGDYPFIIWSDYPHGVMENITGILKVRCPYQICLQGYYLNPKNTSTKYENIHAYATAEFEDTQFVQNWHRSPYDATLEAYLRPLDFKGLFKTKVFHAPYENGQACLKLWEANKTYALRIIDGELTFPDGVYSAINATRMYGTYLFLGTQKLYGDDATFKVYFKEAELKPYSALGNWIFVIGVILVFVVGVVLAIYVSPIVAYYWVITGLVLTTIFRIGWWFALG